MSVLWTFLLTLLCVYVCLFVRISVDTTVIIKKICHCLYKRLQICEFPSLPKKWKPQLAIRVFVKKRTKKKSTTLLWTQNQNSLYYYNSNTILIFQTHAILLLKITYMYSRYLLANSLYWLQCLQIILFKKLMGL